jgi:hypothetical protein
MGYEGFIEIFFRYAFSLTLQSPRQALVVLGFGRAGLVMEQA